MGIGRAAGILAALAGLLYAAFLGVLLYQQFTPTAEAARLLTFAQQVTSTAEEGVLVARETAQGRAYDTWTRVTAGMLHDQAQQAATSLRGLRLSGVDKARAEHAARIADEETVAFAALYAEPTPAGGLKALDTLTRLSKEAER